MPSRSSDEASAREKVTPSERRSQQGSSSPARERGAWIGVAVGLAAVAGLATVLVTAVQRDSGQPALPLPWEEPVHPQRDEGRADGSTSLATEALMARTQESQPEPIWWGIERDLPKDPLPGQATPPCRQRGAVVINGGCWGRPESSTPPCGEGDFEWEGLCYRPILAVKRPSTSEPR